MVVHAVCSASGRRHGGNYNFIGQTTFITSTLYNHRGLSDIWKRGNMTKIGKMFLAAAAIFLIFAGTAYSGEQLNQYNRDLNSMKAKNAGQSGTIIKYLDESGLLVQRVLNYDRVVSVVDEISTEKDEPQKLSALTISFSSLMTDYEMAFNQLGVPYEAEFLEGCRITLFLISSSSDLIAKAAGMQKLRNQRDKVKQLASLNKYVQTMSQLVTSEISEKIKAGSLTEGGQAAANEIIEEFNAREMRRARAGLR